MYNKLLNCLDCVRRRTDFVPKVAMVLGSGLGDYAETLKVEYELPYGEIEGFPVSMRGNLFSDMWMRFP